ncbi:MULTISPECIES: phosphoribosyltransferase [Stutzerimonas]|uniref:phosphoribosyltransferase n=1 Tax=Stutzerimonas TaxID=2901164 RepID=UPI00289DBD9B|nr:phosphoribosyltransferase [Stutzerimonas kunmingensis]
MLILTTSPTAILRNGLPDAAVVQALINIRNNGNLVGVISNHPKPGWFDTVFGNRNINFIETDARQNGDIIKKIALKCNVKAHDILVLAAKAEDMQMAKNGRAVLVPAGWSNDPQINGLGLKIASPKELEELTVLTNGWNGQWWFEGQEPNYSVHALMDLSTYGKGITQQSFAHKLTTTVKNGGARLAALLAVTARSLLISNVDQAPDLLWGVYPSSGNTAGADEVLTDFTHRLRTTTSRVRFAKTGEPLFIRHTASEKRSANKGGDRTDPTGQITTLHLNPYYKGKIKGRNIIVIDDCTTYGVSFGVAAAFLRKAGANSVHGIALGKFGNQLSYYEITLNSDPFAPILAGQFELKQMSHFAGKSDSTAQQVLQGLIP